MLEVLEVLEEELVEQRVELATITFVFVLIFFMFSLKLELYGFAQFCGFSQKKKKFFVPLSLLSL